TMEAVRDPSRPLAAFSVARVRNDGLATVLSYEAPLPVLVSRGHATGLAPKAVHLGGGLVNETTCYLEPDDALLLVSDGITQAGLGNGLPLGWQQEGLVRFIGECLSAGTLPRELPQRIEREARKLWKDGGDDTTAALALCRRGQAINLFTGPPADRAEDERAVRRFMQSEGLKVVCGGTTADVVARVLRRQMRIEQNPTSLVAPPRYEIDGIELVTEGAVTLNQVYNVVDEDIRKLKEDSGVTDLCTLLLVADRVNIFLGGASNGSHGDITFRQRGILSRERIVALLAEKLRAAGKLVVVERV
ncbi:MAG: SpoIIE family protein phosphatase, partial [Planctomycetota bacterium]